MAIEPGADWLLIGLDVLLRYTTNELDEAAKHIRATGYPHAEEIAANYPYDGRRVQAANIRGERFSDTRRAQTLSNQQVSNKKEIVVQLGTGCFHGQTLQRLGADGITLSMSVYEPGTKIGEHSHESAYFSTLLKGSYTEKCDFKFRECRPNQALFHPPGEVHADQFHESGGQLFRVELANAWTQRIAGWPEALHEPADYCSGPITFLLMRLYREFTGMDFFSPLIVEGVALEIIAEASRDRLQREQKTPRWVRQLKDFLHAHFAEELSIAEIARSISVHPVHLARVFRQSTGCSIGEYRRRLRVEHAACQLSTSDLPIAAIATEAGFFDQSHFSKTFKTLTGYTPNQYRARAGRR